MKSILRASVAAAFILAAGANAVISEIENDLCGEIDKLIQPRINTLAKLV